MSDAVTYCLAYVPSKPGRRCGAPVDDAELIRCARHAREERRRLRLRPRVEYRGHTIAAAQLDPGGPPWYSVAEHAQVADRAQASTAAALYGEIDACDVDRLPGCHAYVPAAAAPYLGDDGPNWDRFRLSRDDNSHE